METTPAAGHDLARPSRQARFAATRWTVVLTAARSDTTRGRDALAQLCQTQHEPVDWRSPDRLYERRWALTLLERVFERLQQEYRRDGKAALFEATKGCLAQARAAVPYAEAGARLGLSEGALRVAVHRLRQRYRELLRAELADTVSGPEEVQEELRYLFRVLAG